MTFYTNEPWSIEDTDLRLTVTFRDDIEIARPRQTAVDLRDQLGGAAQEFAPRISLVRWIGPPEHVDLIDVGYVMEDETVDGFDGRTNVEAIGRAPGIIVDVVSTGFLASPTIRYSVVETEIPDFWVPTNEDVVELPR
jgi:hypothetical protein